METISLGQEYLTELESEVRATRRCLESIPHDLYSWKPHEKSMNMGYMALLVADIPRWITHTIEKGFVDFATYEQFPLSTTDALLKHFDKNIEDAKKALRSVSNDELNNGQFTLRNGETILMSATRKETVQSSINHWVHHRGQLTVYMRLNDIAVPSIYGPSADERTFG